MNVVETLTKIEKDAKSNHVKEVRYVEAIIIGHVIRQGDIYVHRVSDDHARGQKLKTQQLVRGVTMGSRHVAESPAKLYEGVQAPAWAARALVGPVIVSEGRFKVSHPEHAWLDLPPGVYQVTLQMDARTNQAVQD
jgi:hypothetical protein